MGHRNRLNGKSTGKNFFLIPSSPVASAPNLCPLGATSQAGLRLMAWLCHYFTCWLYPSCPFILTLSPLRVALCLLLLIFHRVTPLGEAQRYFITE